MINWLVLNVVILIVVYFLGVIFSGYWIGFWFYGVDICEQGFGFIGVINVLRILGNVFVLVVLVIDIFKGVLAIVLVCYIYFLVFV